MIPSLRNLRPLTVVPALLSIAIVSFIAQRAIRGTHAEELLATPPRHVDVLDLQLDTSRPAINLEPIRDQSLFHASRAFYVPPPPSAEPAAPPRPDYLLAGTFIIPRKPTVALLTRSGGSGSRKVVAGDDLDGWHVQAVERLRIVLEYNGQQIEIARNARTPSTGMTLAPIARTGLTRSAGVSAAPTDTGAPTIPTPDTPARTVRTLGNAGSTQAAVREASAGPSPQILIEPRLYRSPR